jgi:hypothetical protein
MSFPFDRQIEAFATRNQWQFQGPAALTFKTFPPLMDYWWVSFLILARGDGVWCGDGDQERTPTSSLVPGSSKMIRHLHPAAGTWKVDGGLLFGCTKGKGPAPSASPSPLLPASRLPAEGNSAWPSAPLSYGAADGVAECLESCGHFLPPLPFCIGTAGCRSSTTRKRRAEPRNW